MPMRYSTKDRNGIGAPPLFNEEIADLVIQHIADGWTLARIVALSAEDIRYPRRKATIIEWVNKDEDFGKRYRAAQKIAAEVLVDEARDCADGMHVQTVIDSEGIEVEVNLSADPQRARLMADTRMTQAALLDRKRFAKETKTRVVGDNEDDPVNVQGTVTLYIPDNDRE